MKIKSDFVTNSSSASFIILKKHLTKKQIMLIHNHIEVGKLLSDHTDQNIYCQPNDKWIVNEHEYNMEFFTVMTNFDMWWFLKEIGVKDEHIPPREEDY